MREWLQDIPEQIVTDRLLIRPHRRGDGRALHDAIIDSLADLRRWPAAMGWSLTDPSAQGSEAFCRACSEAFSRRADFPLLITLRDSGTIVGSSGLHRPDWSVPKLEIGWWGRSTYAKRGLITEAVAAILEYGFVHLRARRVFALPDDQNSASWRICERVGMNFEGRMSARSLTARSGTPGFTPWSGDICFPSKPTSASASHPCPKFGRSAPGGQVEGRLSSSRPASAGGAAAPAS